MENSRNLGEELAEGIVTPLWVRARGKSHGAAFADGG